MNQAIFKGSREPFLQKKIESRIGNMLAGPEIRITSFAGFVIFQFNGSVRKSNKGSHPISIRNNEPDKNQTVYLKFSTLHIIYKRYHI